jgi:hypothetical protein
LRFGRAQSRHSRGAIANSVLLNSRENLRHDLLDDNDFQRLRLALLHIRINGPTIFRYEKLVISDENLLSL